MIVYTDSLDGITASNLEGFFVGWPNPPSPATHLKFLRGSDEIILAIDDETRMVVGFVTAITDGVLCAYIPFLEVLPQYQKLGIGGNLMRKVIRKFERLYMIDLLCGQGLQPFYSRFEMRPATAMTVRNFDRQSGA